MFKTIHDTVTAYTGADGLVTGAKNNRTKEISRIDTRIADLEARLRVREDALRREFTAADQAIARLNNQSGALASLGGQYRLF